MTTTRSWAQDCALCISFFPMQFWVWMTDHQLNHQLFSMNGQNLFSTQKYDFLSHTLIICLTSHILCLKLMMAIEPEHAHIVSSNWDNFSVARNNHRSHLFAYIINYIATFQNNVSASLNIFAILRCHTISRNISII